MTPPKSLNVKVKEYQEVLQIFKKNLKYIETLGIDKSHLQTYRLILNYLNDKNVDEIQEVLDKNAIQRKPKNTLSSQLNDENIKELSKDELKSLTSTQKLTRSSLERIAIVRFGVPKGSLSVLRTRDALIQKILTLLAHEDTHEIISSAVLRNQHFETSNNNDK
ncbi:hypothetical protein WCT84_09105 [Pectobacterium brasiliense]|uniref:hypothetical protein n=1 Tax=Pectobacterium brasiliense TaxID=180957 RepID=UPI00301A8889